MTPHHHLPEELLVSYAAGALDPVTSIAVACHLSLCPLCLQVHHTLENIGGVMIDDLPPQPLSETSLDSVLEQLDDVPEFTHAPKVRGESVLPYPLRQYISGDPEALAWSKIGLGLEQFIFLKKSNVCARLLRVKPGYVMPKHTHQGTELTLVLDGGFSDFDQHYERGDMAYADSQTSHAPATSGDQSCLCLVVTDAPLKFSSLLGRVVATWFGF